MQQYSVYIYNYNNTNNIIINNYLNRNPLFCLSLNNTQDLSIFKNQKPVKIYNHDMKKHMFI